MSRVKRVVFSGGGSTGNGSGVGTIDICPDLIDRVNALCRDLDLGYRPLDQDEADPQTLVHVRRVMRDLGLPERTRFAMRELSKMGKKAVSAVLTSCYLLRNEMARQETVNLLRELSSDPEIKAKLLAGISMKHDGTREVCQKALGSSMPSSYMMAILSNPEAPIDERVQAGERLCQSRYLDAIPYLINLLSEANCSKPHERRIVQSLAQNLGILGADIFAPLYQGMKNCPKANCENFYLAFGNTGPAGRQYLLEMFKPNGDFKECRHIIRCLGKQARRDSGAVEALVYLLNTHQAGDWRYLVIEELGKSKLKEAVPALRSLLNDTDSAVRGRCFTALALLNYRDIIPVAEQALSRSSVELQAAEALGYLGEEKGMEHLLSAAVSNAGGKRRLALDALGRLSLAAVGYLTSQLGARDKVTTLAVIEALGKIRGPKAQDRASRALMDVFLWAGTQEIAAACQALKNLGVTSQPVMRVLRRLANDGGSPQEQKAAQAALDHLTHRTPNTGGNIPGEKD